MNNYKTIKAYTESEPIKIKKSKFIGIAAPVKATTDIKDILNDIKLNYADASHWCYAYKIGVQSPLTKANDDGEPNNSAGKPILGQIISSDLTNILVVVIRYYGGTKLGVGGLISAYKETAKLVLEKTKVEIKELKVHVKIQFKYDLLNISMRIIKQYQLEIIEQDMQLDCRMEILVPKRIFSEVKNKIEATYGLNYTVL